jgi:hypothetical protein
MVDATLGQNHQVIDFYGRLAQTPDGTLQPGDSVVFCFRAQAFYTRSLVAYLHASAPEPRALRQLI